MNKFFGVGTIVQMKSNKNSNLTKFKNRDLFACANNVIAGASITGSPVIIIQTICVDNMKWTILVG